MAEIYRDAKTGEFTMKQKRADGTSNLTVIPAKYSPDDKYAKYRRIARDREDAESEQSQQRKFAIFELVNCSIPIIEF